MQGCADLLFKSDDAKQIFQSLIPEVEDDLHRSNVSLTFRPGCIGLKIEGGDIVSMRAALNTWIRLVKIAFEMASI